MTFSPMTETSLLAAVCCSVLPLVAFAVVMIGTRNRRRLSAGISIGAVGVSLLCSVFLLVRHWHADEPLRFVGTWLISGEITVPIGVLLDPTSLLMLVVVAGICFLVQVYSLGYMAGDPGFTRYYAFMSLFAWAMISLTLSPTLLQLYVFWELVGLSSYLLIGFWYEKFSASEAGKKAFVMTRLGDVAFLLGLLVVLVEFGNLDILELNSLAPLQRMDPAVITLSALLIFGGIVGKSAQFPLLTWLPDAMEGPTPVSALLHSATMVAAGVFLFARIFPFFRLSSTAMTVFLLIGTVSMLLSSTMAMVARDIKQVWAYSTVSQLGFMIMGLAAGSFFSGVFHLTTHAGFKALLFLCSGVFIHAFGTNDMFEIGRRGGRGLHIPMVCMVIAAAALSGIPPLSGFFSKEAILGALAELDNPVWLAAGLLGAFLTAYYTFRLLFIVLFPRRQEPEGDGDGKDGGHGAHDPHAHRQEYRAMAGPLLVLAAVTLVLGFAHGPLERFLHFEGAAAGGHGPHWLLYAALGLASAGVALAYLEFGLPGAAQVGFVERMPALKKLFAERWYLDRMYRWLLDRIVYGMVSRACSFNDRKVIDGGLDGLSRGTIASGRRLSSLHGEMIQYRILVVFAVVALLVLHFFLQ
ncbi:MAG: NADH-quinone oxidoreductase subunit L [Desulfobacteraceae bacterium]|nr:NADH-quinone oxidoreductase subunit L [Desulfobacteraceae bacterium]